MQWSILHLLADQDFWSPELRERATKLNEEIGRVLANRNGWAESARRQAETDVVDLDFDLLVTMSALRTLRAEVLQSELRLRRSLLAFDDLRIAEQSQAVDAAIIELDKSRERIRKSLEKLGYRPAVDGVPDPCRIQPGMIESHPDVYAARARLGSLQHEVQTREFRQQNEAAARQVLCELEQLRGAVVVA